MESTITIFHAILFGGNYSTLSQIFRIVTAILIAYMAKNSPLLGKCLKEFFWLFALFLLIITYYAELINALEFIGIL